MSIEIQIAKRIKALRKERGGTLNELAQASGVSSSMISLIERGETSPTAAVLNKLADALNVSLASLFSPESAEKKPLPVSRQAEQPVWADPDSGYIRRHLSPDGASTSVQLAEILFPPNKSVSFDSMVGTAIIHQQIWMLEGEMNVSTAEATWHLKTGDCLAILVDQHVVFHNPTNEQSRYLVAISTP